MWPMRSKMPSSLDSRVSPIARQAEHVLIAANGGPTFFRSVAAAMALAEAVVAFMLARGGEEGMDGLRDMERRLDHLGVYWQADSERRLRG